MNIIERLSPDPIPDIHPMPAHLVTGNVPNYTKTPKLFLGCLWSIPISLPLLIGRATSLCHGKICGRRQDHLSMNVSARLATIGSRKKLPISFPTLVNFLQMPCAKQPKMMPVWTK